MSNNFSTSILEQQCIGDSLVVINSNFYNLDTAITTLSGYIQQVLTTTFPSITASLQQQVSNAIQVVPAQVVPAGIISYFGTMDVPVGYLECDGTAYDTNTYYALFKAIGYTYGGSTNRFRVPSLTGIFIPQLNMDLMACIKF